MGHVVTILVANALKWLLLYDSHYSRVTKRLKAATNELSICKIQFQLEVFRLSTFLLVLEEPLYEKKDKRRTSLSTLHIVWSIAVKNFLDYGLKKGLIPTPREFCRRSLS